MSIFLSEEYQDADVGYRKIEEQLKGLLKRINVNKSINSEKMDDFEYQVYENQYSEMDSAKLIDHLTYK